MGGKALSCNTPVRLPKAQADELGAQCVAKLEALYPGRRAAYMSSYREKPDAGDADILVEADERYDPFVAAEALGAVEIVRNGPVTSIGVLVRPEVPYRENNVFQVDLIKSAPVEFDYASNYFQWSDLGNFVGRIAHASFCAHKHNGLWFYFRDPDAPDYLFREIVLTRDYREALAYLGFDVERYNQGFDTLEDIYAFTASSTYFNPDIYLLENRNAISRVRDKKRPAYTGFLRWCEEQPNLPAFQFPADKSAWLPRLMEHFPWFKQDYEEALADLNELKAAKAKFNGAWVSQITGLQGKELGALMKRFRESFGSDQAQREFVLGATPEALTTRLLHVQSQMDA